MLISWIDQYIDARIAAALADTRRIDSYIDRRVDMAVSATCAKLESTADRAWAAVRVLWERLRRAEHDAAAADASLDAAKLAEAREVLDYAQRTADAAIPIMPDEDRLLPGRSDARRDQAHRIALQECKLRGLSPQYLKRVNNGGRAK